MSQPQSTPIRPSSLDIRAYLDADEKKDLLRLLTAGSVDDGKSTLIGRLLFDSKKIYDDQLAALERDSKRVGNAGDAIDYALLLDGLKAEREEGITIDVAYRYFSTNRRKFIIADTPGHEQYTRNMITGGSTANLAIILIDARKGVITQTRRHTYLVSLLGIKHIVLAVNKMDLVDFSQQVFDDIVNDYRQLTDHLGIDDVTPFPLSARDGDNVVELSPRTPWYSGTTLLDFLETVPIHADRNFDDFRFPVQYVLRPDLDFRGFCGKVASGIVRVGDEVVALPSMKRSHVKGIYGPNSQPSDTGLTPDPSPKERGVDTSDVQSHATTASTGDHSPLLGRGAGGEAGTRGEVSFAFPPQSVTITLEDEIDISRGEMIVHPDNLPNIGRHFTTMLVWMDEEPMDTSKQFFLKHNTNTTRATIAALRTKIDINNGPYQTLTAFEAPVPTASTEAAPSFSPSATPVPPSLSSPSTSPSAAAPSPSPSAAAVPDGSPSGCRPLSPFQLNEIGQVDILTAKTLFFDAYARNRQTGAFILIDPITNNTSAVGIILAPLDESALATDSLPTLDLPRLGIDPAHYDAIDRAVRDLARQGLEVKVIK